MNKVSCDGGVSGPGDVSFGTWTLKEGTKCGSEDTSTAKEETLSGPGPGLF